MKVPFSWLMQYFASPLDPLEVAERLTLSGIEVEEVRGVGALDPNVVVGEVREVSALPGGAGFRLVVDTGGTRSIVTRAEGVSVGQKLAVALPGATLLSSNLEQLEDVSESEVRGVRSAGMLASAATLGIGSDAEHAFLFGADAPIGAPVSQVFSATKSEADWVLLLAILPNIARCQSMLGVAREVAALLAQPLTPPAPIAAIRISHEGPSKLAPQIQAPDVGRVLRLTLIENVQVTESPRWLKRRLLLAGMTPINNVVDASNYVMLELGEPSHPYDADLLPSCDLAVRRARAGERLLTLQQAEGEEPMALPEGVPLIVSADRPVAIAGVIGGRESAISTRTTRVLLEAAAFDYVAIRRSQQAAKVYSEASARFSRGVNPELPALASARFIEILRETSPGLRVVDQNEVSLGIPEPRRLELSLSELNDSLGTQLDLDAAYECLSRIGLEVLQEPAAARLIVNVGNDRADITVPRDLVEEVARLAGYDRIPETLPKEPIPERRHDDWVSRREALRDLLVRLGLQEILSYSLTSPEVEARLGAGHPGIELPAHVGLLNPVSVERSVLRSSLFGGLLQAMAVNLKHSPLCRMFEIGPAFHPRASARELPTEELRVTALLGGLASEPGLQDAKPRALDFFDAKAVLEAMFAGLGLPGIELEVGDAAPYRPGAVARVLRGGRSYGWIGAIHPKVLSAFDLAGRPVFAFDLDLEALLRDAPPRRSFSDYDRLPSIELDVAMILDRAIQAGRIRSVARQAAGELLRDVEVFDQFFSAEFGEDRKAIAIRLRLNAGQRTLEMAEAVQVRERVARALESELSARIRE
ncbi:MAG TPA: phenylalanine--tRNA ligase subunit beta [Polyangiaceae bacterium]|nr:phenylalanine--tRNA ligase subunit beta [Polyangiaceae bacterium]